MNHQSHVWKTLFCKSGHMIICTKPKLHVIIDIHLSENLDLLFDAMSVVGCGRQWAMVACIFMGWSSCTRFFAFKVPWNSFRASKIADINFGMYFYSFFTLTGVTSHFFDCFQYLRWYLWSPLAVVAISCSTCALWSSIARCSLARYAWFLHFINKIMLIRLSLTGMQFFLE